MAATLVASYEPAGPASAPVTGTLEHFLTERYCLYTLDRRRRLRRADIHHPPWPLQPAGSVIGNVIWILLAGWWLALGHLITGC